jgi:hypothetical protein
MKKPSGNVLLRYKIFLYGIPALNGITNELNKCPDVSQGFVHSNLIFTRTYISTIKHIGFYRRLV